MAGRDEALRALGQVRITQPIEPLLGQVVVDVWGNLLAVHLDRPGLLGTEVGALGAQIVRAVHAAEQRAAQIMAEHVRQPRGQSGTAWGAVQDSRYWSSCERARGGADRAARA